jgi:hypothetical protein
MPSDPTQVASVGLKLALGGAELFFRFLAAFAHLACQALC